MSKADQVRTAINRARGKLQTMGFRDFSVTLRTITKSGSYDPGLGTQGTDTHDDLVIDPAPTVEPVNLRMIEFSSGLLKAGDIRIAKINRDTQFAAKIQDPNTVWIVSGPSINDEFEIVGGQLVCKPTEWIAIVRKKQ